MMMMTMMTVVMMLTPRMMSSLPFRRLVAGESRGRIGEKVAASSI